VAETPPVDPDAAREAAERILAGEEFAPPEPSLVERLLERLAEWLDGLLPSFGGGGGGATVVGWLLLAAVAVAVVWLLARAWRRRRPRPSRPSAVVEVTVGAAGAVDWRAAAAEAGAAGRWADALRCRYRALVAELGRRGVVGPDTALTPGEARAGVAASVPPAAPPFDGAADLFERTWFGTDPAGATDAERFDALEREVLAAADEDHR
jgi:hypothetical protein